MISFTQHPIPLRWRWLLTCLLWLALSPAVRAAAAATPASPLIVGIFESPPFVMTARERPSGLAIDLWEDIAARGQIAYRYRAYPSMRALLDAVQALQVVLAVTSLTINEQRARQMDFSQPWFEGGVRLLVSRQHRSSAVFRAVRHL